eukprot:TRINITY_DN245_c0_g1_i7.p1 TRINITY_DN245_c0_g1~~TRINITY_DN245_c0_g1_i7.p1  ORF type:complete len:133 (-),score=51.99 TRINITY_DN245_c0_g1_i7:16-414(-)
MCIRDRYQRRVHGEQNTFLKKEMNKFVIIGIALLAVLSGVLVYKGVTRSAAKQRAIQQNTTPQPQPQQQQPGFLGPQQPANQTPQETKPQDVKKPVTEEEEESIQDNKSEDCLLYTSPSPRDRQKSRMPSSA